MKIKAFGSILALFMLGFATIQSATAQSASGRYQYSLEDGYTKYVEFDARGDANGGASGYMSLTDEAKITYLDVDGTGVREETVSGFFIKAEFDGMVVNKNQAVMSGTVRESSIQDLVGQRVLLTVEDNVEGDKLTWGVYRPIVIDWIPSDAEWKEDPGVGLRWWATDAEVKGDIGYAMPRDTSITTQSFPIASYAFVEPVRWAGSIIVRA